MNTARLPQQRLSELVARFSRARIAVVGDFFLDKYLDVDPLLQEHSVETGRTAHQVVRIRTSPGCAGTIMCNLASLGAGTLYAVGLRGDDGEGYQLEKDLGKLGCNSEHLHVESGWYTPTYLKPRNLRDPSLAGEHDRYDTKSRVATPAAASERIVDSLDVLLPHVDAVMVMDQVEETNRGVVTDRVREALNKCAASQAGVHFVADSRRRIRQFRRMIVKPNQFETVGHDLPRPEDDVDRTELRQATERLRSEVEGPVVVSCGCRGMLVLDRQWAQVPGVQLEGTIDSTGAGDSASAGLLMALCAGGDLAEAAIVANLVASLTIQQLATTGVARPDELAGRLALWHQQQGISPQESAP